MQGPNDLSGDPNPVLEKHEAIMRRRSRLTHVAVRILVLIGESLAYGPISKDNARYDSIVNMREWMERVKNIISEQNDETNKEIMIILDSLDMLEGRKAPDKETLEQTLAIISAISEHKKNGYFVTKDETDLEGYYGFRTMNLSPTV